MITTYQANIENEIIFGKRKTNTVDTYYIGLSHTAINTSGGGITEPSDPNYHRIKIENNSSNFSTSSDGIATNLTELSFPITSTEWSNITYWFIADSFSGGNILYYGSLTTPMMVDIHQILKFKANSIKIKRVGV